MVNIQNYFSKIYFINIRSDIASPLEELPKFNQQGIIFTNKTIEFADYLLKLEDNSNILYELFI